MDTLPEKKRVKPLLEGRHAGKTARVQGEGLRMLLGVFNGGNPEHERIDTQSQTFKGKLSGTQNRKPRKRGEWG
jgi:hypothetical protein